jgi:hypothetical protein
MRRILPVLLVAVMAIPAFALEMSPTGVTRSQLTVPRTNSTLFPAYDNTNFDPDGDGYANWTSLGDAFGDGNNYGFQDTARTKWTTIKKIEFSAVSTNDYSTGGGNTDLATMISFWDGTIQAGALGNRTPGTVVAGMNQFVTNLPSNGLFTLSLGVAITLNPTTFGGIAQGFFDAANGFGVTRGSTGVILSAPQYLHPANAPPNGGGDTALESNGNSDRFYFMGAVLGGQAPDPLNWTGAFWFGGFDPIPDNSGLNGTGGTNPYTGMYFGMTPEPASLLLLAAGAGLALRRRR